MGKFIGLIAAVVDQTDGGFTQVTEQLDFLDETWIYYCRPQLGPPKPGWRDLAAGTLRVAYEPPPIRHDRVEWAARVTREEATGAYQYMAEAMGVEPGNNLFHLALPPGYLPIAAAWDIPPLYGHPDGARFVLGWGGGEQTLWPTFRFEPVVGEAFAGRARELDLAIESASRQQRKAVLNAWLPADEPDRADLLRRLNDRMSAEEVQTLVFELGIDYDNLAGATKVSKLREMLLYLARQGQLPHLLRHLQQRYAYLLAG